MTPVPVLSLPRQSVDVALRDGSTVHVRPVTAADRDGIAAFLGAMSPDSLYFRGCGQVDVDWLSDWAVDTDASDRYGLVATTGLPPVIVAHAGYVRIDAQRAEVAFEVADRLQGFGIGTLLLGQLATVAARHGIDTFVASVMASNRKMLEVFRRSGFPLDERLEVGEVEVSFPTAISEEVLTAFESRQHHSSASAVRTFLRPASVAVVGASRHPDAVGGTLMRNLLDGGFTGTVYPVNPHADTILGLPAHRSVAELPEAPELVVVAVPAPGVAAVAEDAARRGARALLVISSGFSEVGGEGPERQRVLVDICRRSGMRLIGPNCLGLLNTDPEVRLNATFARRLPPAGRVGMMSQSGGVAIALMDVAAELGLGLSSFVSVGNKTDISGNDLLEYWEQDAATGLIALYLESFGNPRRFARVARRVSTTKPILAVKSGRTPAGSRAASSHTAALLSAADVTVDALFAQAGVIRADTLGELLDTAALIGTQPLPRGGRVVIVTNGGGPGIMCADSCHAAGLDVVELDAAISRRLERIVPEHSACGNPIDMTAAATAEHYGAVFETLLGTDATDAVISLFVPALGTAAADVAAAIDAAAAGADIPFASVIIGAAADAVPRPDGAGAARFRLPEDAVRALAQAAEHARWLARPTGRTVEPEGCRPDDARRIIAEAVAAGRDWLREDEVRELLDCYRIPRVRTEFAAGAEEAVALAAEITGPVALKARAAGLLHKSDVGGVILDLVGDAAVRSGAEEIRRAVAAAGYELDGLVVQQMAPSGVELLVGVVHDPSFGPVVACGAGGTTAELLRDVAVRITPLTDLDASELVRSLRTFPLLDGYRGAPRLDVRAVEDVLLRVGAMVERHPEIAELDLNPLIVAALGAYASDARVRVRPPEPERPVGAI
ncbi:MAG TPA: GNAT family N-acetyltransferase [Solirubrobacteraceae bacterium]|nr:GNAT family N-acetyltransferase [Solirubrobacteraceae bacterium]